MRPKWRGAGVVDALNAVAFDTDGMFAYAYDRSTRSIVRIASAADEEEEPRLELRLESKFRRHRWLVYCIFYGGGSANENSERLFVCFYDQKKRDFCLVELTIDVKKRALHAAGEKHYLAVADSTPPERLGYTAQASATAIEVRKTLILIVNFRSKFSAYFLHNTKNRRGDRAPKFLVYSL